ncbi:TPA: Hok/Gef family protein [Salmonella enterica subsp. salamae serovar 35:g,m,s,t:-]|nr:Hok/Gef family protein [Salmonella enterica subsp. salamae serovar 35:g,m,s,t:-]HCA3439726.1 Hok/Gef family protein [Salmonella enterica subsp. salamae serovar 35:g,m,s,t:-]HCA3549742.1 Hok/Gef family protein [Salmonella enterica subsp. salamae serovar 35:g,m,s,t:-]HCA3549760.1 Hok/Gef family protein [Salmonella enterica subsp. salamae serovar 35:g,m,s,t:-]
MPGKTLLFGLIVICMTVLVLTAVVRRSLCELEIKAGDVQVVAQLAYEAD